MRTTNIEAAKAVADAIRTSLGPRGMDKMVCARPNASLPQCSLARHRLLHMLPGLQVCQANGEVIITNDGATILNKMTVLQPAAKMLVELAKSQARCLRSPRSLPATSSCFELGWQIRALCSFTLVAFTAFHLLLLGGLQPAALSLTTKPWRANPGQPWPRRMWWRGTAPRP